MIAHIVLFRPRAELSQNERQALVEGLEAALLNIPSIRRAQVGPRVTHGRPGYEQKMRVDFPYAAVLEFEDLDGLKAFLEHPAHLQLAPRFYGALEEGLIYDYELNAAGNGSWIS